MIFYASIKSRTKVAHTENCRYTQLIADHNLKKYKHLSDALIDGYHLSKCSGCKDYSLLSPNSIIGEKLKCHNIKIDYNDDKTFDIYTPTSTWKVVYYRKKKYPSLYHKNECYSPNVASRIEGYHFQQCYYGGFERIIDYIISHDEFRDRNKVNYAPIVAGKGKVYIDPNLRGLLKARHKKSERQQHLESYQKANDGKIHNANQQHVSKKAQRRKRNKKNAERNAANLENLERVYSLLETIKV